MATDVECVAKIALKCEVNGCARSCHGLKSVVALLCRLEPWTMRFGDGRVRATTRWARPRP
jgi:hypothetical protein